MAIGKDYSIDARKLMRMSVSDRNAMMNHGTFRQEILNALTPSELARIFPQMYGPGSGGGRMSSGLSGVLSKESSGGVSGGGTFDSAALPPPTNNAPIETQSFFNRFMNLEESSSGTSSSTVPTMQPNLSGFRVTGGATIPKNADKETVAALNSVASRYGLRPEAIAMMINLESGWSTKAPTGSYHGLTQMGAATFREAGGKLGGLSWDQYLNATPAQQINAYGDWLQHYKFTEQLQKYKINLSGMSAPQQAAYLQGMQFAPNAQGWKKEFAAGNYNSRTTPTSQARALGSTSIADMTRYYEGIASKNPAVVEQLQRPPQEAVAPEVATTQQAAPQKKGTLLFLHGMQSHYSGKRPEQVEAEARRYATAKGLNFEVINVSGDYKPEQRKAAIERINQGGITHVLGFSAGGYNMGSVIDGLSPAAKSQIQGVTIVGAPNTGKIPGIPTELVPDPKTGHMDGINVLAQREEASAKRGTGAIYPEGQSLGPKESAGGPQRDKLTNVQGFQEITPEKQTARPGHYYGTLDIDGVKIPFGTGGVTDRSGRFFASAPAGSSLIGALNPHKVPGGVGYEVPGLNVKDPRSGYTRSGIVIHTNGSQNDMQKLYSHGCISIAKDHWPKFQEAIAAFRKKYGAAYINLDPYGNVYSVTARPVYDPSGKIIEAQSVQQTIDSKQQIGQLSPKLALPQGMSPELTQYVSGLNQKDQIEFIEKMNRLPNGVDIANRMYAETKNAQSTVQVVQQNNVEQLSKPYQPNEDFGKIDKAPTTSSLKGVDLTQKFPQGTQRFFHEGGNMSGVNPKLIQVLKEASKDLPPGFRVTTVSGRDSRAKTKNHPHGAAIDTQIIGPDGTVYSNRGFGPGHQLYEKLAQSMDVRGQQMFPGTKYIWGGAWTAAKGDRMHMQIYDPEWKENHPGAATVAGMGYDWQKGVKPGLWAGPQAAQQFMSSEQVKAYREQITQRYAQENAPKATPVSTSPQQLSPVPTSLGPNESAGGPQRQQVQQGPGPTAVPTPITSSPSQGPSFEEDPAINYLRNTRAFTDNELKAVYYKGRQNDLATGLKEKLDSAKSWGITPSAETIRTGSKLLGTSGWMGDPQLKELSDFAKLPVRQQDAKEGSPSQESILKSLQSQKQQNVPQLYTGGDVKGENLAIVDRNSNQIKAFSNSSETHLRTKDGISVVPSGRTDATQIAKQQIGPSDAKAPDPNTSSEDTAKMTVQNVNAPAVNRPVLFASNESWGNVPDSPATDRSVTRSAFNQRGSSKFSGIGNWHT